ncbi:hypothetical protein JCM8547_000964 [Rhodosporidiobolus lusitaniae]
MSSSTAPTLSSLRSLDSSSASSRPTSVIIHNVRGAEGGVEAITARRRNSGSFKHMSTGGLVSNSPFMQRLNGGSSSSPTKPSSPTKMSFSTTMKATATPKAASLYGAESRIPTLASGGGRKTSGLRKASGDNAVTGPVKENSNPSLHELSMNGFDGEKKDSPIDLSSRRSNSPSVPFKPTRQPGGPSPPLNTASNASALSSSSVPAPFKPSRPTFSSSGASSARRPSQDDDLPRRQSSSYTALKKNGLVSSSPFTSSSSTNPPRLPSSATTASSPELQQAPYEIGALAHESAPFGYGEQVSPTLAEEATFSAPSSKASGQVGLGARPGAPAATTARVYTGTANPPPASPANSTSNLSPIRRGMRGPRAMGGDASLDDGEETEREEPQSRSLRRQPSNKTVTWAETEEVLEFEVEEERRRSMMSDASTLSDDDDARRYYGRDSSEEESFGEEEDSFENGYINHVGNGSYSFEEGGSVVEIRNGDEDAASDAEESVVSTGSSAVDDMIGQIDSYIHEGESYDVIPDVFSPSQSPSFSDAPDLPNHHHGIRPPVSGYTSPRQPQPQSAFSVSTVSGSTNDDGADVLSNSCYGDEDDEQDGREEDHLRAARESVLARARASQSQQAPGSPVRPSLPSPPPLSQGQFSGLPAVPAVPSYLGEPIRKSESQYSLPDIKGTSPFLGFEDDGTAGSVVTLDSRSAPVAIPTTQPLQPQQHSSAPSTPRSSSPAGHTRVPSQSTPTSAVSSHTLSGDSPILSALSRPDLSPALSRKASLVGSDVSSSAFSFYGSTANGSLRGGTVRLTGDRMAERRKNHEALFASSSTTNRSSDAANEMSGSFGSFPQPSSTAAATTGSVDYPSSSNSLSRSSRGPFYPPQAIEARPEGESYDVIPDVFSPSQIPYFSDAPDLPNHHHGIRSPVSGYTSPRQPQPQSAFSVSTVSGSTNDDGADVLSNSCYGDEDDEQDGREEDHLRAARESVLARARASQSQQAPGSPVRPSLPSPPPLSQGQFSGLPAVPAVPSYLGEPIRKSESQYSLPDIKGTSPFLGFEDDGTAGSVVTLDSRSAPVAIPTTQPLQPQQHSSAPSTPRSSSPAGHTRVPSQSTPTSAVSSHTLSGDSPILSALSRPDLSPALSRKASLVGSDVSSSAFSFYGSTANGSLRGGTVRLTGDRMAERRKNHEALFASSSTTNRSSDAVNEMSGSFGSFPQPSSTAAATTGSVDCPSSSNSLSLSARGPFYPPQAIEARPAPKARSATLSSSMLPTIAASWQRGLLGVSVGSPLTGEVAEEMQSPLERLRRGAEGHEGGQGGWRSGDSLLGVNEVAEGRGEEEEEENEGEETEREDEGQHAQMRRSASNQSALEAREQAIIAKRREKAGLAPPTAAKRKGGRRRSRSTGDADVAETASSHPMEFTHTMPELGFERRIAEEGSDDAAFASNVLESLDDIYNSRNRTYRVREAKRLVVVSDFNNSKAGDVDPGRAWRKKRPSDVHAINRSMSTMSIGSQQARKSRELSGQLFVHLRDVTFNNVSMPRQKTSVTATLDNGRQQVPAATRELSSKIALKKEFELVCSENLAFSIHFTVPPAPPTPAPAPSPAPTPPASPSKPHRALRIFSSPKKRNATPSKLPTPTLPPPTPDPFYDYVSSPDNVLATAKVTFATEALNCRLKKSRILVPFGPKKNASPRSCSGSLVVELLFVPAVPGVVKAALPKSMDEVMEGLELAEWATKVTHESVLTQMGGDCTVWRRRQVKLRGSTLVPYSEITKRAHVEINLTLVASLEDLNILSMLTPGSSRSTSSSKYHDDEDDAMGRMENSFRLVFKDGNRIDFFADSEGEKRRWMEVLQEVVGKPEGKKSPPEWAVAVKKLPLPAAAKAA